MDMDTPRNPDETRSEGAAAKRAPLVSREVLMGVVRRDPDALAAFFEAYFERIYALAYRLLGSREQAEDATHDIFLKIHRGAHQLDPGRDPGPWVATVTANHCRDFWRSRAYKLGMRSASFEERPEFQDTLPGSGATPAEEAERGAVERLVREAVNELPDDMREVVILHDFEGLGHDEIAALVGASHAAVRKRYSRALARLGDRLEGRY